MSEDGECDHPSLIPVWMDVALRFEAGDGGVRSTVKVLSAGV